MSKRVCPEVFPKEYVRVYVKGSIFGWYVQGFMSKRVCPDIFRKGYVKESMSEGKSKEYIISYVKGSMSVSVP